MAQNNYPIYQAGFISFIILATVVFASTFGTIVYFNADLTSVPAWEQDTPSHPEKTLHATVASSSSLPLTPSNSDQIHIEYAKIIEVLDDHTVRVIKDGGIDIVQFLGIVPPQISQTENYNRCFGITPRKKLAEMVLGKSVFLIADATRIASNEPLQMRYGYLEDATFLNKVVIEEGIAKADTDTQSQYIYKDEFTEDENKAVSQQRGIWTSPCSPTPTIIPRNSPTPTLRIATKKTNRSQVQTVMSEQTMLSPTLTQAIITHSSSLTRKPTLTATPIPTRIPIPTHQPLPTVKAASQPPTASLNANLIFALLNTYRKNKGLEPFIKDDWLCQLATSRGPELYEEIFVTGKIHEGLYNRNLPYWIIENMAHYPSEEIIVNWWLGSSIHRKAIEGNYVYSCGTCVGNNCAQLFTNYIAK